MHPASFSFARRTTLLGLLAALAGAAAAQAPQCTSGRIIGASPAANATIQICQTLLSQDPAFIAFVERMNAMARENTEFRKRIERMTQALGTTSTELSETQMRTLAKSLANRLGVEAAQKSQLRLSLDIERISIGLEELQDRVAEARRNRDSAAQANSALTAGGGDAVARLDLDTANRIFEHLGSIDESVKVVGTKVDIVGGRVSELKDIAALENAFSRLSDIAKTKPRGDLGQALAMRRLLDDGRTFRGMELSGLYFRGAELPAADLGEANLQMTDFSEARLPGAKLQKADLTAASFAGVKLTDGDLTLAFAPFVRAPNAVFDKANLARSSWIAANLQGASFRNADLRGADMELADLRGADFTGAKLGNTFFGGADLRGAKFDQAEIANTDMLAAVVDSSTMTGAQRAGLCASRMDRRKDFSINHATPSSKYDSGYVYDELLQYRASAVIFPTTVNKAFPRCKPAPAETWPTRLAPVYDGTWRSGYRQNLQNSLLGVAGRRNEFVEIVLERIASANARAPLAAGIPELASFREARRKALDDRLVQNAREASPKRMLTLGDFGNDVQFVLLRRMSPGTLDALDIDWKYLTTDSTPDAWPRMFNRDEIDVLVDRDKVTTDTYRSWVTLRANAWKDPVLSIPKPGDFIKTGQYHLAELARTLGVPTTDNLVPTGELRLGEERNISTVLLVEGGAERVRKLVQEQADAKAQTGAELVLKSVRLVEVPEATHPQLRRFLVWTASLRTSSGP